MGGCTDRWMDGWMDGWSPHRQRDGCCMCHELETVGRVDGGGLTINRESAWISLN